MISSSRIALSVRATLRDNFAASGFAYTDAELVDAINRALQYCGTIATDMTVTLREIPLAAGSVQRLPNVSTRLVTLVGNALGAAVQEKVGLRTYNGDAPIALVDIKFMQTLRRNYFGQPATKIVTSFAVHPDTYNAFEVFPPNNGEGRILASIRDELPYITALGNDDIAIPNFFEGAIINFAVYVALTRDGDDNPLTADGKRYLDLCNTQLAALSGTPQGGQ